MTFPSFHWTPPKGDRDDSFWDDKGKIVNDICTRAEQSCRITDTDANTLRRLYNAMSARTQERIDYLSRAANQDVVKRVDDGDGRFNAEGVRVDIRTDGSPHSSAWRGIFG